MRHFTYGCGVATLLFATPSAKRREAQPVARAASPGGSRLVLVEDNDGMRNAVGKYLTENGFECRAFSDGQEALRAMTSGPRPDLVITDVMMQGMDGLALLRRIRADQRLCAIPVVLLTARGLAPDRIAGYSAGASAYLSKPFDPEELLALVNTLLTNALLARASVLQDELGSLAEDVSATKRLLQLLILQNQRSQGAGPGSGVVAPMPPLSPLALRAQLAADYGGGALLYDPGSAAAGIAATTAAAAAANSRLSLPSRARTGIQMTKNVPRLTNREKDVLELLGEGMLNKEIAATLSLSKSHIEKYIRRLFDKTGTANRTELVRRGLQLGLLSLDPPPPSTGIPMLPMREVPPEQGWGQAKNM